MKKATREPKTIDIRDYSGKLYTSDLRGFGICGDKIFIGAIDAKVFMFDLSYKGKKLDEPKEI